MRRLRAFFALGAVLGVACGHTQAGTLNTSDRGWYDSSGKHDPSNDNYVAGTVPGVTYHDFFVFDLSGVSTPLTSASLVAVNPSSAGGTATYTLYDVTTSVTSLINGTGGVAAFDDLGSGTVYGSVTVTDATNTFVSVALNADGLAALNAHLGGTFAIGGALSGSGYVFGFSGGQGPGDGNTYLNYTPGTSAVPEPASLSLVGFGAVGMFGYGLRRKAKAAT
jgi:hypothetical protein